MIMNTDTPETDAAYKNHAWDMHDHIPLDFARKLERERDELQRAYDTAIRQMNQAIAKAEWLRTDAIAKLERERDEAREQLDAERALADRLAEVIQCVMIEERDLPATSCRGFIDFDQAILALTAWKEARDGSR